MFPVVIFLPCRHFPSLKASGDPFSLLRQKPAFRSFGRKLYRKKVQGGLQPGLGPGGGRAGHPTTPPGGPATGRDGSRLGAPAPAVQGVGEGGVLLDRDGEERWAHPTLSPWLEREAGLISTVYRRGAIRFRPFHGWSVTQPWPPAPPQPPRPRPAPPAAPTPPGISLPGSLSWPWRGRAWRC